MVLRARAVAGKITLHDLAACGVGHTVVAMLVDGEGFNRYDRRESLMHHGDGSEDNGEISGHGEDDDGEESEDAT